MLARSYLQLFRIPGTFTAASNIFLGFFATYNAETTWLVLPLLVASSVSLYIAGMVLNDFFDYDVDRKERPFRPLPSGKISKNRVLMLGAFFIISANIWSYMASYQSFFLSMMMSSLILFYNMQAKKIIPLGILILCLIRFSNILLGASTVSLTNQSLLLPIPLGILVAGIGMLSTVETKSATKSITVFNLIMIVITVLSLVAIFYERLNENFVIFMAFFVISTALPLVVFSHKTSVSVQKIITFQLLSIIILDAAITVLFVELFYGLIIISFYLPAFLTGKKIYVT